MRFGATAAVRAVASAAAVAVLAGCGLAGCGLAVQAPDLFRVTRAGARGQRLTLLVNDGGTIACDGGKRKALPDRMLLEARDLATSLNSDASAKLRFAASARSVFSYTVTVQSGTFTFPDTAALGRKELSQLELFVVQAAVDPCGINP
jgi:hypothetical protein